MKPSNSMQKLSVSEGGGMEAQHSPVPSPWSGGPVSLWTAAAGSPGAPPYPASETHTGHPNITACKQRHHHPQHSNIHYTTLS